eukprot:gnl/Dysnectes_brevis/5011_a7017_463.p1 GENE.gnl/Dysnectes_brevis/5011_a7017_463~~gnl/Dysnectes_brevis/5011_a7017_463.p1  ORF type:complete len:339 (-),score=74.41 gnl/Dysnectes_brevis/5011_a7017_463:141-1157(-)
MYRLASVFRCPCPIWEACEGQPHQLKDIYFVHHPMVLWYIWVPSCILVFLAGFFDAFHSDTSFILFLGRASSFLLAISAITYSIQIIRTLVRLRWIYYRRKFGLYTFSPNTLLFFRTWFFFATIVDTLLVLSAVTMAGASWTDATFLPYLAMFQGVAGLALGWLLLPLPVTMFTRQLCFTYWADHTRFTAPFIWWQLELTPALRLLPDTAVKTGNYTAVMLLDQIRSIHLAQVPASARLSSGRTTMTYFYCLALVLGGRLGGENPRLLFIRGLPEGIFPSVSDWEFLQVLVKERPALADQVTVLGERARQLQMDLSDWLAADQENLIPLGPVAFEDTV